MAPEAGDVEIRATPGGIELTLKVVPGASRTRVAGVLGTALKVAVAAPPEGGKANAAVMRLLAEALGVSKSDVEIVSGHGQRLKRVAVRGLTAADARARLGVR
jgi:uncharacterized protein (TIGR00251 family)